MIADHVFMGYGPKFFPVDIRNEPFTILLEEQLTPIRVAHRMHSSIMEHALNQHPPTPIHRDMRHSCHHAILYMSQQNIR